MRTKPQITHAAPDLGGFGVKGKGEEAMSLAETLLTGKPLAKAKADRVLPKLKPRSKPLFGCKAEHPPTTRAPWFVHWLVLGVALVFLAVVGAQLMIAS